MSIHKQPKETLEDKAAYDELKALNHYNKPAGMTIDIFFLIWFEWWIEFREFRQWRLNFHHPPFLTQVVHKEKIWDVLAWNSKIINVSGIESLLHSKLMERRIRLSETNASLMPNTVPGSLAGRLTIPTPVVQKCTFNITSTTKCGEPCVPMSKFCPKHILEDPNQVLFRKCAVVVASEEADDQSQTTDDGPCETAIPDIYDSHSCVYHTQFQHLFPTSALEMEAIKKADKQVRFLFLYYKILVFMMRS